MLGRVPRFLHRFLAAFLRATAHLSAFAYVVGRPFPGFVGREGSYPLDFTIAPPERQRRLGVLVRPLLAIPALLLNQAYGWVLLVVAFLGWIAALVTGRMPGGLRDLGVASIRYQTQAGAYLFLLTAALSGFVSRARRAASRRAGARRGASVVPRPGAGGVTVPRLVVAAAVAVGWVALAWLLAGSVVPDDLSLPTVDVDAVFGEQLVDRAERYERFLYVDWLAREGRPPRDARGVRPLRRPLRARVGGRADRDRDAPRDARPRDRVADAAARSRSPRSGGSDATASRRSATSRRSSAAGSGWAGRSSPSASRSSS